jgi:hypothetical protein
MRELIKQRAMRFTMRYTCQICWRRMETTVGYDFPTDRAARKHVSSHVVNGWWVGDAQEVCVVCLGHAQEALQRVGIRAAKGCVPPFRKWAEYALACKQEFAKSALSALDVVFKDCSDGPLPVKGTPEDAFLKDLFRRQKLLRKHIT